MSGVVLPEKLVKTGLSVHCGVGICDCDSQSGRIPGRDICGTPALLEYLREEIFPQLAPPPYTEIEMERLPHGKPVYAFTEKANNIQVVVKQFEDCLISSRRAWLLAEREYLNLKLLRERFGMDRGASQVVAPLGRKEGLSALLVTKRVPGRMLDHYIVEATSGQQSQPLFAKLSQLAKFFVKLHRNTETHMWVSPDLPRRCLGRILSGLEHDLSYFPEEEAIRAYANRWWNENGLLSEDRLVVLHGDATPTNFLFEDEQLVGIDLEAMRWGDRCWDLGFLAAELKHHFMWRTGDGWAAEPYIGHFLWEYATNYADRQFFHRVTRRIPLYMALGLLRIAKNSWVDIGHRERLFVEAKKCLKYGL